DIAKSDVVLFKAFKQLRRPLAGAEGQKVGGRRQRRDRVYLLHIFKQLVFKRNSGGRMAQKQVFIKQHGHYKRLHHYAGIEDRLHLADFINILRLTDQVTKAQASCRKGF
ncbi:MAG: hypothetical protein ACD_39C00077G0001, partial [uncultured bacterium]